MKNRRNTLTDEEKLVLRAKELDRGAWSDIYDRHFNTIYAYIYRRVGYSFLAEDLAATVFVRALESIGRYKYRGVPLIGWLMRIARNLIVDHFRRVQRAPRDPLQVEPVSNEQSPEQAAELSELRGQLQGAVKHLTDEQRQVVTLRFVDGLSSEEVGSLLGKSQVAVRALQHRALAALRRHLRKEGNDG